MNNNAINFSYGLSSLDLREIDCAVAVLWFLTEDGNVDEVSAKEIANFLREHSLRGQINVTRLSRNLSKSSETIKGKVTGTFRIRLPSKQKLYERYGSFLTRRSIKIRDHIVDPADFLNTRKYFESLAIQINGSYELGYFDACAVMCRRLLESLLIEAFEQNGQGSAIKKDQGYLQLGDIIGVAISGKHIQLSRGAGRILERTKSVGDAAAHSRTYITKRSDIDDIRHSYRTVLSELSHLARIH